MSKLFKKPGQKYNVTVYVSTVILKKPGNNLDKDSLINLAIERGNKLVTSSDKRFVLNASQDAVIEFNELLQLEATMYPLDSNHTKYEEKVAKLLVRKKKKTFMGSDYQIIGNLQFPLHELIINLEENLPLEGKQLIKECILFPGSSIEYKMDMVYEGGGDDSSSHNHAPPPRTASSNAIPPLSPTSLGANYDKTFNFNAPNPLEDGNKDIKSPSTSSSADNSEKSGSRNITSPPVPPPPVPAVASSFPLAPQLSGASNFGWASFQAASTPEKGQVHPSNDEKPVDDVFTSAVDFGKVADFDPFGDEKGEQGAGQGNGDASQSRERVDSTFAEWNTSHASSSTPPPVEAKKVPLPLSSFFKGAPPSESKSASMHPLKINPLPLTSSLPQAPPLANSTVANADPCYIDPNFTDINFVKSGMVQQEEKLQQAEDFINYQSITISNLQNEVTQYQAKIHEMASVILIQEEELQQSQSLITYQENLITNCNNEMITLKQSMIDAEKRLETSIQSIIGNGNGSVNKESGVSRTSSFSITSKESLIESKKEIQKAEESLLTMIEQVKELHHTFHEKQKKYLLLQKQQQQSSVKGKNCSTAATTNASAIASSKKPIKQNSFLTTGSSATKVGGDRAAEVPEETSYDAGAEVRNLKEQLESFKNREIQLENEKFQLTVELSSLEEKLQQQHSSVTNSSSSVVPPGSASGSTVRDEENELKQLKEELKELEDLRLKLLQAADYISYQNEIIASSNEEISRLQQQVTSTMATPSLSPSPILPQGRGGSDEENNKAIREEDKRLKMSLAEVTGKLKYFEGNNDEAGTSSAGVNRVSKAELEIEIEELKEKIAEASDYILYQNDTLRAKEQEILSLKEQQSGPQIGKVDDSLLEELNKKVSQASEYINFLQEQLNEKTEENQRLEETVANTTSTTSQENAATLAEKEKEIEELKQKLQRSSELIAIQRDELELKEEKFLSLRNSASTPPRSQQGSAAEIEELKEKLQQASEYIAYQTEQITLLQQATIATPAAAETVEKEEMQSTSHHEELEELMSKIQQAADYINYQNENLTEKQSTIDNLTAQLATAKLENEKQQRENVELQVSLTKSLKDIEEMKEKLSQSSQSYGSLTQNYSELNSSFTEANKELLKRDAQEKAVIAAHNEEMERLKADHLLEINKIQEILNKCNVQLKKDEKDIATLTSEINSLTQTLKQTQDQTVTQQQKITTVEQENLKLMKELDDKDIVTSALRNSFETRAANTPSNTTSDEEVEEMKTKLQQAAKYITYQNEEISRLQQEVERQQMDVEEEERNIKEFEDLRAKVQQASEYIAYQTESLNNASEELQRLNEELNKKDDEISQLTKALKAATTATTATSNTPGSALKGRGGDKLSVAPPPLSPTNSTTAGASEAEAVKRLSGQLKKTEVEKNTIESELERLKQRFQQSLNDMKEHDTLSIRQEQQIQSLNEELEEREDTIAELRKSLKENEETTKKIQSANDHMTSENNETIEKLTKELEEKQEQLITLQQASASSSSLSASQIKELEELRNKLHHASEYITYQTNSLKEAEKEIERSTSELEKAKQSKENRFADHDAGAPSPPSSPPSSSVTTSEVTALKNTITQLKEENMKLEQFAVTIGKPPVVTSTEGVAPNSKKIIDELNKQIKQASDYILYQRESLTKAERDITRLTAEVEKGSSSSAEAVASVELLKKETAVLKQQKEQLEKASESLKNQRQLSNESPDSSLSPNIPLSSGPPSPLSPLPPNDNREYLLQQQLLLTIAKETQDLLNAYLLASSEGKASTEPFDLLSNNKSQQSVAELKTILFQLFSSFKEAISKEISLRSLKNQENYEILNQLIECKLQYAIVNTELDKQKKQFMDLRKEYLKLKNFVNNNNSNNNSSNAIQNRG